MKRILLLILLSITLLYALDIAEDTTWGPEDNPYIFDENVNVLEGATLTILPGCEILMKAMPSGASGLFYVTDSGEAHAKIFHVYGKIVAIGTEDEPITFTRNPDTEGFAWGGIFVDDTADTPVFEYCELMGVYRNVFTDGSKTVGGICVRGCDFRIKYCTFTNCKAGITYQNLPCDVMIYGNTFTKTEPGQYATDIYYDAINGYSDWDYSSSPQIIIARNRFIDINRSYDGTYHGGGAVKHWLFNYHFSPEESIDNLNDEITPQRDLWVSNYYGCIFMNRGITSGGGVPDTMSYFRKNYMYYPPIGLPSGVSSSGFNVITDNQFIGNLDIDDRFADSTVVCNNVVYTSSSDTFYQPENPNIIYNNLFTGYSFLYPTFADCTMLNNTYNTNHTSCFGTENYDCLVYNNILHAAEETMAWGGPATVLSNNFMNHPFPEFATDGGGNIIGDDPMFADTLNGDYSLAEGSLCIDAGMPDGDYPPTDILGNVRVWDGDGDGTATIDIGAFEYGAPFWGGIEGYVYEEDGETPLDIAKITVDGVQFPEWSDSTGWFRILTGPGTFTLNVERMYYEGQQLSGIVVEQGAATYREITLQSLAAHDYDNLIQQYTITMEQNSPNPFNPTTTISFSIPKDDKVELKVYNIKGQLVKTLVNDHLEAGMHKAVWNGDNQSGKNVSSGIYLYRLESGGRAIARKMLLLK